MEEQRPPKRRKLNPIELVKIVELFDLPEEVLLHILTELSVLDLLKLCKLHKKIEFICDKFKVFSEFILSDLASLNKTLVYLETEFVNKGSLVPQSKNLIQFKHEKFFGPEYKQVYKDIDTKVLIKEYLRIIDEAFAFYSNVHVYFPFPIYFFELKFLPRMEEEMIKDTPGFYYYIVLLADDRHNEVRPGEQNTRLAGVKDLKRDHVPEIFGNPAKWGFQFLESQPTYNLLKFPGGIIVGELDQEFGNWITNKISTWNENHLYDFPCKDAVLQETYEDGIGGYDIFAGEQEIMGAVPFDFVLGQPPVNGPLVRMPQDWWIPTQYRVLLLLESMEIQIISPVIPYLVDLEFSYAPSEFLSWKLFDKEGLQENWGFEVHSIVYKAEDFVKIRDLNGKTLAHLNLSIFFLVTKGSIEFKNINERFFLKKNDISLGDGPYIYITRLTIVEPRVLHKESLFMVPSERRKAMSLENVSLNLEENILGKTIDPTSEHRMISVNDKALLFNIEKNTPFCKHVHEQKILYHYLTELKHPDDLVLCPICKNSPEFK